MKVRCIHSGVDKDTQFEYLEGEWYSSYDMKDGYWIVIYGECDRGYVYNYLCRKSDFIPIEEFREMRLKELDI